MSNAEWANLVLGVFTVVGVSVLAFLLVMGLRYLLGYGEPKDNYQSKRIRRNVFKTPR